MAAFRGNQVKLLRRCIIAARMAKTPDDEMVEVGLINGVHPSTAKSLVALGLIEYCRPFDRNVHQSINYVRLLHTGVENEEY